MAQALWNAEPSVYEDNANHDDLFSLINPFGLIFCFFKNFLLGDYSNETP